MRYVEGHDLKERLKRGRLDPADAIDILAQVASALDAAHARGLVHRDVKPGNLLVMDVEAGHSTAGPSAGQSYPLPLLRSP
jgi:serine/threonine-protein kinase